MFPIQSSSAASSNFPVKPSSVWAECEADPDFVANCFEGDDTVSLLPRSSNRENNNKKASDDEEKTELFAVTPL